MVDLLDGLDVSRETMERLRDYERQLLSWSASINLISRTTYADAWVRHILDSAQLLQYCPSTAQLWLDIGSGGGLPGIVVSILALETQPQTSFVLVESDSRKSAFLKLMIVRYGLNAKVLTQRIEDIPPLSADILSARALAPLTTLIDYASVHLSDRGVAIFPKGRNLEQEVALAQEHWTFTLAQKPSILDAESGILLISGIKAKAGAE